jgi:uncharacterized protein (DUF2252 family)
LVFDVNDFDETLPGPFEWDVKRLAVSFAVAGRDMGFSAKVRRQAVLSAVEGYRTAMREFAAQPLLDVWYAHLDVDDVIARLRSQVSTKKVKAADKIMAKARTHDTMQALGKLTTTVDGRRRIISNPPTVQPIEEVSGLAAEETYNLIRTVLDKYRRTLPESRRYLLEQFALEQVGRNVVGVGSVGTRAWVVLLDAADGTEPLFLQAKEAQTSVLDSYCGSSKHNNQGERVVVGQHLMQATSDIFLGWTRARGTDGQDRDYYLRQLMDWKLSADIERMRPKDLIAYGHICGWTLARAHARSGDRIAIAAYLGRTGAFDDAIAEFAESYAEQNERDHAAFADAVKQGRAEAVSGV